MLRALARSLAISFPPAFPFFSPSRVRQGETVPSPSHPRMLLVFPPFYRGPPPPLLSSPFVSPSILFCSLRKARGCRPSAVLLPVFLLRVHVPLFSFSLPSSERPPCVFPDNATEPGQGCVFCICDAIFIRPQQTRAPRRVVDARVAWLLKFPHDVTTFRGIRSVKKLLQPAALLRGREIVRTHNCSGR